MEKKVWSRKKELSDDKFRNIRKILVPFFRVARSSEALMSNSERMVPLNLFISDLLFLTFDLNNRSLFS